MGENSGVFDGVKSNWTLSCYPTRSIIREDLWAHKLSSTKTSFLGGGYFESIT